MPSLSFLQFKTLKVLLIFFVHIKAFAHFAVNKTTSHFCRNFYAFKTLLAVFDKFHVCTYKYSQL